MKFASALLKKTTLIIAGVLVTLVILIILCISPIAKYLIEKYDVHYSGREITVGRSYVNPFTGHITLSGVKIFELRSDSVFISAGSISAEFDLFKMLSKKFEISELTLNDIKMSLIQNKKELNFDDIIKLFRPDSSKKSGKKEVDFNLIGIKIKNGELFYFEKSIPVKYAIKNINIESKGFSSHLDTIAMRFSFKPADSEGEAKGDLSFHKTTLDYILSANVAKYDLSFLEQYLRDLSNFGKIRANLDADIKATGNFKEKQNINTRGLIAVNDFHVGKKVNEDYASFKKFTLRIEQLSPKNKKYLFDSVSLLNPYFKYEQYDTLNNIQMMFGKKGAKAANSSEYNLIIKVGQYIADLARNFFKSEYEINRLAIYNGKCRYNDYSLLEKFSVSADPITILADSIKRTGEEPVNFVFETGIKPYGKVSVNVSINPQDSSDFDMSYNLEQIPVSMFNPYIVSLTSFPLDRGTIELKGKWKVRDGNINSTNRLVVIDPRIYKREPHKGHKWIPLRLLFFFVREKGNVIDYEIPITGNLKDPKFNFKDVLLDILRNIFLKPMSAPYIAHVRSVEGKIEKSLILRWGMNQSELEWEQEECLDRLSDFLTKNPSAIITVNQIVFEEKEREYILFKEAKKKYYLSNTGKKQEQLNEEDISKIDNTSVKDPSFVAYLDEKTKSDDRLLFSINDKCLALIGEKTLDKQFRQLVHDRENRFVDYFKNKQIADQVKMNPYENKVPYNGFSFYKIDYKEEFPGELIKAFTSLQELNDAPPRNKFKKERETRRSLIRRNR
jgi:hypothetical protein